MFIGSRGAFIPRLVWQSLFLVVLIVGLPPMARAQLAQPLYERASQLFEKNEGEEALRVSRKSLEVAEREYGTNDLRLIPHFDQLAYLASKQNQMGEADRVCRRWIRLIDQAGKGESPAMVEALWFQTNLHFVQRDSRRASVPVRKAAAILEKHAPVSPIAGEVFQRAGQIHAQLKQWDESGHYYQLALTAHRKAEPPDARRVAECLDGLASVELAAGRTPKAEALLREALKGMETAYGRDAPETAFFLMSLALALPGKAQTPEAEALFQRALTIAATHFGPDDSRTRIIAGNLGQRYLDQGKKDLAEPLLQRAGQVRSASPRNETPSANPTP